MKKGSFDHNLLLYNNDNNNNINYYNNDNFNNKYCYTYILYIHFIQTQLGYLRLVFSQNQ